MSNIKKRQAKTKIISFRLSELNYSYISKEARKQGVTMTDYILNKVTSDKQKSVIKKPYPFQKL